MPELIEPKEIQIKTQSGEEKTYIISKMPYANGGREVCSQFIPTAMPKVGNYEVNEKLMLKMMGFVAVKTGGAQIRLETAELVSNHVPDFQTGIRLEKEMIEYNFGFFDPAKISNFLDGLTQSFLQKISPILIQLREQLSQNGEPPSKS